MWIGFHIRILLWKMNNIALIQQKSYLLQKFRYAITCRENAVYENLFIHVERLQILLALLITIEKFINNRGILQLLLSNALLYAFFRVDFLE